jgi:hypothetical protein
MKSETGEEGNFSTLRGELGRTGLFDVGITRTFSSKCYEARDGFIKAKPPFLATFDFYVLLGTLRDISCCGSRYPGYGILIASENPTSQGGAADLIIFRQNFLLRELVHPPARTFHIHTSQPFPFSPIYDLD